jgi:hypothetical protein
MSVLRNIWGDLVDKRLWPVAAVLVVALVALPVLVLKPAPAEKPPAPVASVSGPAPMVSDPAAIVEARSSGPIGGTRKNPFAQQHVARANKSSTPGSSGPAAPAKALSASGVTATPVTTSGGSTPSSGTVTTPSVTTPAKTPKPATTPKPASGKGVTKLKVRFGPTNGKRKYILLDPGAPLPTGVDPVIVFVDMAQDGKAAEFIVSSEAQPQGDGRCKPSKTVCAQLFLKFGNTEFFDVTGPNGTVQYQLDVLKAVKS